MKMLVTFGQSHAHQIGEVTLNKDTVAVIECSDPNEGRTIAFDYFGDKFCFTYIEGSEPKDFMMYFPLGKIYLN